MTCVCASAVRMYGYKVATSDIMYTCRHVILYVFLCTCARARALAMFADRYTSQSAFRG